MFSSKKGKAQQPPLAIVRANLEEIAAAWREVRMLTNCDTPAVVKDMYIAQLERSIGALLENLRRYEGRV